MYVRADCAAGQPDRTKNSPRMEFFILPGLEGRPESEGRGCQALLQLPQGKAKGRQLGLAVEHHALSGE